MNYSHKTVWKVEPQEYLLASFYIDNAINAIEIRIICHRDIRVDASLNDETSSMFVKVVGDDWRSKVNVPRKWKKSFVRKDFDSWMMII